MTDCIAIIPARGGSKRIPKKNIKNFFGKPMIYYSISNAISSKCFKKIIVSTDDKQIAKISKKYGAEILFKRPKNLSGDNALTRDVVNHTINFVKDKGVKFKYACLIYPTAPLIQKKKLIEGYKIIKTNKYDFAFTVCEYQYPIQRSIKINKKNQIRMIYPKFRYVMSNKLEKTYHDAGQFYFGKMESFLKYKPTFGAKSCPIILPRYQVQDIDDIDDWKIAENLFKTFNEKKYNNK
jgi:pseudaminic acid cytidylyltransferase